MNADSVAALGELASDVFLVPVGNDLVLVEAGDAVTRRSVDSVDQVMRPITVLGLSSAPVADIFAGATARAVVAPDRFGGGFDADDLEAFVCQLR